MKPFLKVIIVLLSSITASAYAADVSWEYMGAQSQQGMGFSEPYYLARLVDADKNTSMYVECRAPDGMIATRLVFGVRTATDYDESLQGREGLELKFEIDDQSYTLDAEVDNNPLLNMLTKDKPKLAVRSKPVFADDSMRILTAIEASNSPIKISIANSNTGFEQQGSDHVIQRLLYDCEKSVGVPDYVFDALEDRADKIFKWGDRRAKGIDPFGDKATAMLIKARILIDEQVSSTEHYFLRHLLTAKDNHEIQVRYKTNRLKVGDFNFKPARDVLLSLITDMSCAVSYWVLASGSEQQRQLASQRIRHALEQQLQNEPNQKPEALRDEVLKQGKPESIE